MLEQDEPTFANWDQDVTAVEERYDLQDPAVVGPELVAAAEAVAARYDAIRDAPEETWARRGLRDNGSEFTVDRIARYHLHDVLHHSHDVRGTAARATVAAYDGGRGAVQRRVLGHERRGPRRARLARRCRRGRRVGARDRQRRWPRRDPARGPRADRATYRRHARLRRADAQPRLRRRRAGPADRRPRAGRTTASGRAPACSTSHARTSRPSCATWPGPPGRAGRWPCRSRRATARSGRCTDTCRRRGGSSTGARRRCGRCSPTPAGGCTELAHGIGGSGQAWLTIRAVQF